MNTRKWFSGLVALALIAFTAGCGAGNTNMLIVGRVGGFVCGFVTFK